MLLLAVSASVFWCSLDTVSTAVPVRGLEEIQLSAKKLQTSSDYIFNNNSNNNGTYIAQIRRCSKCANAHQRQTDMFQFVLESVRRDVCRPQIVWQTAPHSWSTDREAAVTVTCPHPWDDALARVGRS